MRWRGSLAAAAIVAAMAGVAWSLAEPPRRDSLDALPGTMWSLACAAVLFGLCGLPITRRLLPQSLRAREWLWVLPVGACASALALTVLGLLGLRPWMSLIVLLPAGALLSRRSVRREGWPQTPRSELAWVGLLALVVLSLAVMPMMLRLHFLAVTGVGSDAHMAAGSADFLQHAYPLAREFHLPVDRMPPLWRSKFPIYYAFGGVAQLSGLESWQVMVPLIALLLALAAVGLYLLARDTMGAPLAVAVAAAFLAGTNRIALHTALNPYFNQLWGYFALMFALVLAWQVFRPGEAPGDRRRGLVLLGLFSAILVFAYPLAAPVALAPFAVFAYLERRDRRRRGERVPRLRDLYRGKRDLLWIVPLLFLLGQPLRGIVEKARGAAEVLANPERELIAWAGDLLDFIPDQQFFSLPVTSFGRLCMLAVVVLAVVALSRAPRRLAWGLGVMLALSLSVAYYFRQYEYGWYFHFKILAYVAPLMVLLAVVGATTRWRRAGSAFAALLAALAVGSVSAELDETGLQLGKPTIELAHWARELPAGASVRLDMEPEQQLWGAYFLAERRVCSTDPLLNTDYPRVPFSRKADFVVVTRDLPRPADAAGQALRRNEGYELYRLDPGTPGRDRCSQRMKSRVYTF